MVRNLPKGSVIAVSGAKGTGKTTFAATCAPPSMVEQVFYHDSERSANRIVQQLESMGKSFGHYLDLEGRFNNLPKVGDLLDNINKGKLPWVDNSQRNALEGYYEYVIDDLATNMTKGSYKVYVHDTIEMLEAGMAAWVEDHKKEAGWTTKAYGRIWTDSVYPLYRQIISSIQARGVEVVILSSHLRTPWVGDHPVANKVEPGGKKVLYLVSNLMLWFVHDVKNDDGAPAALVLKERLEDLGVKKDEDEWDIKRMLPQRIPHCTWADIDRYLVKGCSIANPQSGEKPSVDEADMMSEFLNDAQMKLMLLAAEEDAKKIEESTVPVFKVDTSIGIDKVVERVKELRGQGVENDAIQTTLMGEGVSLPIILQALSK